MQTEEVKQWRHSSYKAIIPFIVFVIFYFGFSILTRDFSKVPMTVAFIISSALYGLNETDATAVLNILIFLN